jgi:hypothetical protein
MKLKSMKKLMAVLLSLCVVFSLVACGNSSSDDATESGSVSDASEEASTEDSDIPENEITGDPSADDAFVVWAWNTDFVTLEDLLIEQNPDLEDRLVFVNCGGSGYYQDKIDSILSDPTNELYPDLMLLEVGYVQKYVESDYLLSLEDIGITAEDTANQFQYNIDLGSDSNGVQKASFWQATPGCIQIRADLAEKYLGTTDQAELEEMFSSWDSILEAARKVNEESDGMVKLFSGYDDLKYIFLNGGRSVGWYDANDVIQMDGAMVDYMDYSKTLYDEELTFNTTMWDTDWVALKDGDGESSEAAIAYCGCPWYTYWCLTDTWNDNTILVDAPLQFYWGGTGLAATVECSDTELAAEIIRSCTCDADFMTSIYKANGDFVNNTAAIDSIISDGIEGTSTFKLYGDQSIPEFFAARGDGIDVSLVKAEDSVINESLFPNAVTAYATGASDLNTAIDDFKASVHDTYSYLSVE